jgi:hypothetical protein
MGRARQQLGAVAVASASVRHHSRHGLKPTKALNLDTLPVAQAIRQVLSDRDFVEREKLLKPEYRDSLRPYAGHCYAASEAYYHLLGGATSGLMPCRVKLNKAVRGIPAGTRHWWLVDAAGARIDLTGEQFATPFPYELGVNGGFLTRQPSVRAQKLIDRVLALNPSLVEEAV